MNFSVLMHQEHGQIIVGKNSLKRTVEESI